jgi:hypothetical protein
MAAQSIGEKQVPTIELGHLTEIQKRAYIIADNKLALNAGWDEQMLALEIQDLKDVGYDLELLGFDLNELQSIDDEEKPQDTEGLSTDFTDSYEIIVECVGEFEQRKLLEDLTERGFKCKSLLR